MAKLEGVHNLVGGWYVETNLEVYFNFISAWVLIPCYGVNKESEYRFIPGIHKKIAFSTQGKLARGRELGRLLPNQKCCTLLGVTLYLRTALAIPSPSLSPFPHSSKPNPPFADTNRKLTLSRQQSLKLRWQQRV